ALVRFGVNSNNLTRDSRPMLQTMVKGRRERQPDGSMESTVGVRMIIAPNGQYALAQAPGSLYLVRLAQPLPAGTPEKSPITISLYDSKQPPDVRVEMVPGPPGYWLDWSSDSSY